MQTEADRISRSLQLTTNRIGTLIRGIRGLNRRGKDASRLTSEYLEQLRRNNANLAAGQLIGADMTAFENLSPLPYITDLVGLSETRRRAREWYGVSDCLRTAPVVEPVRFLEAAE
jgi:hypothetical protein